MTETEQLIADAKEAGFYFAEHDETVCIKAYKNIELIEWLTDFSAIRDKRKDAEIERLTNTLRPVT